MADNLRGLLLPYVPRLVVDWLGTDPATRHRRLEGSLLFADVSGFTALTETLARQGKSGAEEMGDILNRLFEELLAPAYEFRGGLLKWGGDAVLLLFDGDQHAERAAASAWEMQRVIRSAGRVTTSGGRVRLGMSIGVHTGPIDAVLCGDSHRELVITGPAATTVALMEKSASAGQVVVSPTTATRLTPAGAAVGERVGDGWLLVTPPDATRPGVRAPKRPAAIDLRQAMAAPLHEHIGAGAVEHEHRHVAVGFLEMSGTDRLAEEDPAALLGAVDHVVSRCQRAALAAEVTLLSTDVNVDGGKIILISGAPRRRGDDEVRIVAALLEALAHPGSLRLRAGATSGRVFAGDFGPPYRRTYSVAGDCVNLAARLMAAARPGELLVAEEMAGRLAERFDTDPVRPLTLKGKAEPVAARQVRRREAARGHADDARLPLVGRVAELDRLLGLLTEVRAGAGRSVDLVGPAGIGKSRLLEELAAVSGASVHWLDGDVYGEVTPYQPVRRFVLERLGLAPDAPKAAVADALEAFVAAGCPELVPWLPLLGRVVDVDLALTPVVADLEPKARKERTEWAISALLAAFVTEPSVLVFNDAHLMDEASVDLLRRLVLDTPHRPWLLVTSYRPDERAEVAEETEMIELEALDDGAAQELIRLASESSPISPHVLRKLAERAAGNPLFLTELVAATLDDDLGGELPSSVEEVLTVRIDRLRPGQRSALRTAAVLGMEVDPDLVVAVAGRSGTEPSNAVEELRGLSGFLEELDDGRWTFRHQLVREVAYEGLPYRRRRDLHGRVADILETTAPADPSELAERAELLSLHCFHGQRAESAWRYSVLAGDRARAKHAMAEAADFYRRALSAASGLTDVDTVPVAEALGDVCFELGEFEASERAYRLAYRSAADAVTRARLCERVAHVRECNGRYSAAVRWLSKGLVHLTGIPGRAAGQLTGQLLFAKARVRHFQGKHRDVVEQANLAKRFAEEHGDETTLARSLEYLDLANATLGTSRHEPLALRSIQLYEKVGDLPGLAHAHNVVGITCYFRGRWDEAVEHYRRSADAYERAGRLWAAAVSRANVAEVLSDQGQLAEAAGIFADSVRVWRALGMRSEVAFGTYMLGRVAAREGRFDDAAELYHAALEHSLSFGEQGEAFVIESLIAECHLLAGDLSAASALTERLLMSEHAFGGDAVMVPLLHRVRGLSLLKVDRAGALQALRLSLQSARRLDALHEVTATLDALVSTLPDDPECPTWRTERDELRQRLGMGESSRARTSLVVDVSARPAGLPQG